MSPPSRHKYHKSGSATKKSKYSIRSTNEQLIWGIHPVLEALHACPSCIKEIFIDKVRYGQRLGELIDLANKNKIPVSSSSEIPDGISRTMDGIKEKEISQGVFARIVFPLVSFDAFLHDLKRAQNPPLILALDSIQDPHNLGAIIRSAVAVGANGIILPKDRSASITASVIKVSAGAIFQLNVCRVINLVNCFNELKEAGIWIFGATKDGAKSIFEVDLTVPACLVIGSEEKGLRPLVAENCDFHISIPMHSSLDSLNASVAAGIILFETVRQRKSQHI